MDIRQKILDELERRGWSHYRLAKAVGEHMSNVAVYEFLKGSKEMTAGNLNHILAVLDFTLLPPPAKPPSAAKSPTAAKAPAKRKRPAGE